MLKAIALPDAIKRVINGHRVFMTIEIEPGTTIEELGMADGFVIVEDDPKPEPKPEPKPKPKPAPAKPKTQPKKSEPVGVDHGKLVALHNAGWSVAKIADELGCSQQTVYNHIEKERNGSEGGAE